MADFVQKDGTAVFDLEILKVIEEKARTVFHDTIDKNGDLTFTFERVVHTKVDYVSGKTLLSVYSGESGKMLKDKAALNYFSFKLVCSFWFNAQAKPYADAQKDTVDMGTTAWKAIVMNDFRKNPANKAAVPSISGANFRAVKKEESDRASFFYGSDDDEPDAVDEECLVSSVLADATATSIGGGAAVTAADSESSKSAAASPSPTTADQSSGSVAATPAISTGGGAAAKVARSPSTAVQSNGSSSPEARVRAAVLQSQTNAFKFSKKAQLLNAGVKEDSTLLDKTILGKSIFKKGLAAAAAAGQQTKSVSVCNPEMAAAAAENEARLQFDREQVALEEAKSKMSSVRDDENAINDAIAFNRTAGINANEARAFATLSLARAAALPPMLTEESSGPPAKKAKPANEFATPNGKRKTRAAAVPRAKRSKVSN